MLESFIVRLVLVWECLLHFGWLLSHKRCSQFFPVALADSHGALD